MLAPLYTSENTQTSTTFLKISLSQGILKFCNLHCCHSQCFLLEVGKLFRASSTSNRRYLLFFRLMTLFVLVRLILVKIAAMEWTRTFSYQCSIEFSYSRSNVRSIEIVIFILEWEPSYISHLMAKEHSLSRSLWKCSKELNVVSRGILRMSMVSLYSTKH